MELKEVRYKQSLTLETFSELILNGIESRQ